MLAEEDFAVADGEGDFGEGRHLGGRKGEAPSANDVQRKPSAARFVAEETLDGEERFLSPQTPFDVVIDGMAE